nr:hypothetical protein [uncultured Draconibacterium sp.]
MKNLIILTIALLFALSGCSPKVVTSISKKNEPLDYTEKVAVIELSQAIPSGADELGEIKIGDAGFSTNCSWEVVIEKAKEEARKVGGNAIKITEHKLPSIMGSSCHRIKAKILKIDNPEDLIQEEEVLTLDVDYAILNIYRYSGAGALVSYDIHLGDTVICRVKNNYKTTVHVTKEGLNSLWCKTEAKTEIPIDIEMGRTYFIRCGIKMGFFVGHPTLELMDYKTGKVEFDAFEAKNDETGQL